MYLIIDICPVNSKKYKVTVNDTFFLPLYKSEMQRFSIQLNSCIADSVIEQEIFNILYKRGRERSLHLLGKTPKTEHEIRQKLEKEYYPEEITERILVFLKSYKYIDDTQYALQYFEHKKHSKSILQIKMDLQRKGINSEIIYKIIADNDGNESEAIERIIQKKFHQNNITDKNTLNKIYMMLRRKGFKHDEIIKCINHLMVLD